MHVSLHHAARSVPSGRDGGARHSAARALRLCAAVLALAASGCGELEPIVEPEIVDLHLTLDTLKTQVRDAQRTLAEVRAELDSRRQELADAQVARAQLEGRVREAERRVTEAHQVIELQREELVAAKAERERVFRSNSQLQSQKPFQRKGAKTGGLSGAGAGGPTVPTGASWQWSYGNPSPAATPAIHPLPAKAAFSAAALKQAPPIAEILVKPGDTLWSLARKYRMSLGRLRSLNYLSDDQIEAGQVLWVTEN